MEVKYEDLKDRYNDIEEFANEITGGWWNYRLIEKTTSWTGKDDKEYSETFYEIHEVYYDGNGQPFAWSENPMSIYFTDNKDVKIILKQIKEACKHNILRIETTKDGESLVSTNKKMKQIKYND